MTFRTLWRTSTMPRGSRKPMLRGGAPRGTAAGADAGPRGAEPRRRGAGSTASPCVRRPPRGSRPRRGSAAAFAGGSLPPGGALGPEAGHACSGTGQRLPRGLRGNSPPQRPAGKAEGPRPVSLLARVAADAGGLGCIRAGSLVEWATCNAATLATPRLRASARSKVPLATSWRTLTY